MIYFLQAGGADGPIKIGFTRHASPVPRLRALQRTRMERLTVLAAVDRCNMKVEKKLHAHFAAHRLRGEWFAPCPELLALVNDIQMAAYRWCAGGADA